MGCGWRRESERIGENGKFSSHGWRRGGWDGGKPPNIPFFDSESPLAPVRDLF